jgi:hypothetical protein
MPWQLPQFAGNSFAPGSPTGDIALFCASAPMQKQQHTLKKNSQRKTPESVLGVRPVIV